jgi:hypothetical protein
MFPSNVVGTKLASVPFTNIPFRQNMEFVGQVEILYRLNFFLEDGHGNGQVALYGLGGIGCVAHESYTTIYSLHTESRR